MGQAVGFCKRAAFLMQADKATLDQMCGSSLPSVRPHTRAAGVGA